MSDDYSSRPATKRVRSDQDHSKGDTKEREEQMQGDDKKDDKDKQDKKDEDWLSQPPFQVGASWEGFETKWRSSCWCGKSEFNGWVTGRC